MSEEELKAAVERDPFTGFALVLTDGRRLEVPEKGRMSISGKVVSVMEVGGAITVIDRESILRIEPLA